MLSNTGRKALKWCSQGLFCTPFSVPEMEFVEMEKLCILFVFVTHVEIKRTRGT